MDRNLMGFHVGGAGSSDTLQERSKTIQVKTLVVLALLILLAVALIFGYSYYHGNRPRENGEPVAAHTPPKFLYSIYKGENKFAHPIAVAVSKNEKVYVSNNDAHNVEVILPNARADRSFGSSGQAPGKLSFPYGIDFLRNDNLLVAETGNYRVQEFTPEGKYVRTFLGQPNQIGLQKPGPVCVDSKDRVYVGDLSGNQVFILDQDGKVLRKIKNISYPHGLAIDEARQKLFVGDSGQVNVKVFSLDKDDDQPLYTIGTFGSEGHFSMVRGLAVDKLGRLYVVDTITSAIRVFDQDGNYLFSFGQQGWNDGEFLYPMGITVSDKGLIYVTDWSNNRVQVWGY